MQEAALVRAEVARAGGELVEAIVMARARQRARVAAAPAKLGWKASQRLWPRGVSFEAMASIMEEGATSAGVVRDIEIVFGREAPRPAIEHEEALAEIMRVAGLVMREARRAEEQAGLEAGSVVERFTRLQERRGLSSNNRNHKLERTCRALAKRLRANTRLARAAREALAGVSL